MAKQLLKLAAVLAPAILMVGCATQQAQPYNYSAFEASNPRSILVLPPLNNSPDVKATESVYSSVTYPLAEAGFYVMPVALVNETFRQNGLTMPADIHNVSPERLHQIFGADAALYMTVDKYGSSYNVISSVTTVAAKAQLLDLKTGAQLWHGEVSVVDDGQGGGNSGGLIGLLVKAAVTQIMNTSINRSHEVAARANSMLLSGGVKNGVLYGPRSPHYKGRDARIPVAEAAATPPASTPRFTSAAAATAATAAPVASQAAPAAVVPAAVPVAAIATASPAPAMVPAAQPVAAAVTAPAQAAIAAPAPAPVLVAGTAHLNAEEQRYVEVMLRARARNQALDPSSTWYRPELYDWVIARKDEFVRAGKKPDVALQMALAAMERN